jgi:hypothetical protein
MQYVCGYDIANTINVFKNSAAFVRERAVRSSAKFCG